MALLVAMHAQAADARLEPTSQICWDIGGPSRLWSSNAGGSSSQSANSFTKQLEEVGSTGNHVVAAL